MIIRIPLAFHVLMRVIRSILLAARREHDQTHLSNLAHYGDESIVQTRAAAPARALLPPPSLASFVQSPGRDGERKDVWRTDRDNRGKGHFLRTGISQSTK